MSGLDPNDARALAGSIAITLRRQLELGNAGVDVGTARRLAIALRTLTRGASEKAPESEKAVEGRSAAAASARPPERHDASRAEEAHPPASRSLKPAAPPKREPRRGSAASATSGRPPWAKALVSSKGVESDALRAIREELGECERCPLSERRAHIVFGAGNPEARLMFVGGMPRADEDRQGEPFVGASGELLNKMIGAMGLSREEVYLTTAVKCRPPANRIPTADEVKCCAPFLDQQIDAVSPEVIVALGTHASSALTSRPVDIKAERGTWTTYRNIPVILTLHPGYLLQTPAAKRAAWSDLQAVMAKLQLSQGSSQ